MSISTSERFWSKVAIAGDDDCWTWKASKRSEKTGYGGFEFNKRTVAAHRMAYELTNGPIPDGLLVRHTCDNRMCCNPRHLLVGTKADNGRDMSERGRSPRGEKSGVSKLTESDVREIRSRYGQETFIKLSKEYGVCKANVMSIVYRQSWKHVT
jgi:hypothetical protein